MLDISEYLPVWDRINMSVVIGGDLIFMLGLFILGGVFWDKLHALLRHDATVVLAGEKIE